MPKIITIFVITALLIIDAAFSTVTMASIAPSFWYGIAYVGLGLSFVVLALPAKLNGNKALWLLLISVSTFLNVSAVLGGSVVDSEQVDIDTDTEVQRIRQQIIDERSALAAAQAEQHISNNPDHLARVGAQIDAINERINGYEDSLSARIDRIESGEMDKSITAQGLINAIKNAILDRRIEEIILWFAAFIALQWGVVVSASWLKKTEPEPAPAPEIEKKKNNPLRQFVAVSWQNMRNGRGNKVVSKSAFMNTLKRRGVNYSNAIYQKYYNRAIERGLIDDQGTILVSDTQKALKEMV